MCACVCVHNVCVRAWVSVCTCVCVRAWVCVCVSSVHVHESYVSCVYRNVCMSFVCLHLVCLHALCLSVLLCYIYTYI